MPVGRAADSISVQKVWDAIRSATFQKQSSDANRIQKYLQKTLNCTQSQSELYLKQVLEDGLISVHKVAAKGTKTGTEVELYKIVDEQKDLRKGHDWYCIDCHLAGVVTPCATCHRVFHVECACKKQSLFKLEGNKKISDYSSVLKSSQGPSTSKNLDQTTTLLNESTSSTTLDSSKGDLLIIDESFTSNPSENENGNQDAAQGSFRMDDSRYYYDEAVCSICNMSRSEPEVAVDPKDLNYLLNFVHTRIKAWIPTTLSKRMDSDYSPPEWYTDQDRHWRVRKLFYEPTNIGDITRKIQAKEYTQPHQYKADILTVQHNITIFHGADTQESEASDYLVKDCVYEVSELLQCMDCYRHSNEKKNENWFAIPCRIPHRLVWAKQQGYSYWPAKVIKENPKYCDVRFFGAKNERANIIKTFIKPISVSMSSLNIKKSSAFHKALKELCLHQKLLKNDNLDYNSTLENTPAGSTVVEKEKAPTLKRKSLIRSSTPATTEKRSQSVDSPEDSAAPKLKKRRSSSAGLNNIVVQSRGSDHTTRLSIQKLKKKRKSSTSSRTANTKNVAANYKNVIASINNVAVEQSHVEGHTSAVVKVSSNGESTVQGQNEPRNIIEDANHEEVTSSSETVQIHLQTPNFLDADTKMPKPERQYNESVEKTRRQLEQCPDKDQLIRLALECMQAEIDSLNNEHEMELKTLTQAHNNKISETKKRQWCFNCEQDAIYHCCWNTAYCSTPCQEKHWVAEHKKVCRRKR